MDVRARAARRSRAWLAAGCSCRRAQTKPPRAELTPIALSLARCGRLQRTVTLKVRLPAEFHVQSDKPRDPFLIPTALTVKPPAGIVVDRLVYPKPTDLAQAGRKEPLAVFGGEFSIDVRLTIAADAAPGDIVLPAQLRYQACDDKVCYAPAQGGRAMDPSHRSSLPT